MGEQNIHQIWVIVPRFGGECLAVVFVAVNGGAVDLHLGDIALFHLLIKSGIINFAPLLAIGAGEFVKNRHQYQGDCQPKQNIFCDIGQFNFSR